MAARRLLIVMLVLLGLSTLAAALVPQHSLRGGTTSATTTTQPATTTTTPAVPPPGYVRPTKITVGGRQFPVVSPVKVGEQLVLLVAARFPTQLEIREFGQVGFAAPDAPARFELLPTTPGTFGIQFQPSGKVAAQIRVVAPGHGKKQKAREKKRNAKSRARGESGPA
jgi:hypothetical protein